MNVPIPPDQNASPPGVPPGRWQKVAGLFLLLAVLTGSPWLLLRTSPALDPGREPSAPAPALDIATTTRRLDAEFAAAWTRAGLAPAAPAPMLTLARRLSLGLTGTVPSLEEIRALEKTPAAAALPWWLEHLLRDRRHSDYLAERLARVCVGVEGGPFLIYRRHRMVDWLSDQLYLNRPYDQLVRQLIDARGIWTTQPEVNFITVTVDQNDQGKGPDPQKLARRVARGFLGMRLDCAQCHDDFLNDRWKQKDFHELAAFFGPARLSLTGVRDDPQRDYQVRYHRSKEARRIHPSVPYEPGLLPAGGSPRSRLAAWVTHPQNRAFARTTVNRVWALLFGRPLVEPIDDLPLAGPYPPGLELLADDFVAHGCDLRRLMRVIVASRVFQLESGAGVMDPGRREAGDKLFAAFPITRLRPEQVAGGILQSSTFRTLDASSHVLVRIARFLQQNEFIKRYGDAGEEEFNASSGTIAQRLLFMNGQLVNEHTSEQSMLKASARIAALAPEDRVAVETAYLCALTRRPTVAELRHFTGQLSGQRGSARQRVMSDLCWSLLNATEFSCNH